MLQGPHRDHRRGRERRRIRPFLTGLKLGCKMLPLNIYTFPVLPQRLGKLKEADKLSKFKRRVLLNVYNIQLDVNDPNSDNYTTHVLNICTIVTIPCIR